MSSVIAEIKDDVKTIDLNGRVLFYIYSACDKMEKTNTQNGGYYNGRKNKCQYRI